MAEVSITSAAEPDGAPRIAVLDILRGVAILGILFMNINDMGQSLNASFDDIRHLGWSANDQVAWWLRAVLADGTARCMLEMLFGAGMVILTDRVAEKVGDRLVLRRYYTRNLILFGFGLVHIFILLWPGDILHTYGLAALVAFLFRRLNAKWLIGIGLIYATVTLVGGGSYYVWVMSNRAEVSRVEARAKTGAVLSKDDRKLIADAQKAKAERAKDKAETARAIAAEDVARKGTFRTWGGALWKFIIDLEKNVLEPLFVWEASSLMLIGAGLFKLGVLQGRRSRRFYLWMTLIAYGVGIPMRILGAQAAVAFDERGPHFGGILFEAAREAMTLGHIGLINLLVMSAFGAKLMRPFVAAGRTALTIYIAQTMICLWVLYPPFVLGLYGKMTWGPLMITALIVDAALLMGANIWVRHFDIAPVEWAWRSLVEQRALPWRKRSRIAPAPDGAPALA